MGDDRNDEDGKSHGKDGGSKDDGGKHRDEDNTADGSRDRPIPPPHEPNKHDR